MGRIEKTVFISYRHTNFWTALAVYQNLNANGYDVFFDYKSIPSGDFERTIVENIKSRAHFVLILTPSALERCHEPGDWLRREVEIAMDNQRNVVPLVVESFDFKSPSVAKALTGKLADLKKYQYISIPVEYFDEAMTKLRSDRFLSRSLDSILLPVSATTKQITQEQQNAAGKATPVEEKQLTAEEWFERGYQTTNLEEKIRLYTEAIRIQPHVAGAYLNRGCARLENGDLDGAITDFDEVIRLEPNDIAAYLNRGVARKNKGDLDGAITDYNDFIRLQPHTASGYFGRGTVKYEKGDFVGAMTDFNEAILLEPDYANAYLGRGTVRDEKGDFDGAMADYNETIRLQPDSPDSLTAYSRKGFIADKNGDPDEAIANYDEAIRLRPDYAFAFFSRGLALEKKNELDGAIADYTETIRLKPNLISAYYLRGRLRQKNGNLDDAIADYTEAIRLDPKFAESYAGRGAALYEKKDYQAALTDYQRYIQLNGDNKAGVEKFIPTIRGLIGN